MTTIIAVEFALGAVAAIWFVVAYALRTHGGWHRTEMGWHFMTFTADIGLIFLIGSVARFVDVPFLPQIAVVLYAVVVAGLWWRVVMMHRATRHRPPNERRREDRRHG